MILNIVPLWFAAAGCCSEGFYWCQNTFLLLVNCLLTSHYCFKREAPQTGQLQCLCFHSDVDAHQHLGCKAALKCILAFWAIVCISIHVSCSTVSIGGKIKKSLWFLLPPSIGVMDWSLLVNNDFHLKVETDYKVKSKSVQAKSCFHWHPYKSRGTQGDYRVTLV